MAITLTYDGTTLQLHEDLYWSDELDWHPVQQNVERGLTGAIIVQIGTRIAGRPITLQPEDDNSAWMRRSVVDTLKSWAAVAGRQMTLNLRGSNRTVMFRHHDEPAIEARPVMHINDTDPDDFYLVTLKFMEM